MEQKPYQIGLIGCGTVGTGVLELLHRRRDVFCGLLGRSIEVAKVVVRDIEKSRHAAYSFAEPDAFTDNVAEVTEDPEIELVVEVAGGVDLPRQWMMNSLSNGKDVVTANKAALAFHGDEIFQVANDNDRCVYYEASVAAAIPIIEILQNGLVANQVTHLSGILNGTCNYVLTRMEEAGLGYDEAVEEAQQKGFAEADPTLDVNGQDAAHKLALLARIITRSHVPLEQIFTEGIEQITAEDISFSSSLGYRIKLLSIGSRNEDGSWELRVHPALVQKDEVLARVRREVNAVQVKGDAVGSMLVYGNGAGSLPTASSVVADIVRAAKGDKPIMNSANGQAPRIVSIGEVAVRNYIRVMVLDLPGVLGRVTSFLGMKGISIQSMRQPEAKHGQPVPVVFVTHKVKDSVVSSALAELRERTDLLNGPTTRIRIED